MPRPNKPRTIGAEDAVRANVERLLAEQERSGSWLARKMTERGCPIDQTGVWRSLHKGRRITVDEVIAMADVFGMSVPELMSSE